MSEIEEYSKAMIRGDYRSCIVIEQRHGLYGYPPEIVSIGLAAADHGKDPLDAVDEYLNRDES